jgi:hypothetical protein
MVKAKDTAKARDWDKESLTSMGTRRAGFTVGSPRPLKVGDEEVVTVVSPMGSVLAMVPSMGDKVVSTGLKIKWGLTAYPVVQCL